MSIERGMPRRAAKIGALTSVSLAALAAAAWAQQAPPADTGKLPEIVVTAQQRSQSAEDVPIAMQVVTGEQIQAVGAQNMEDLAAFVPGLTVSGSPTQPYFSIRGIATTIFGVGTDPSVGVYVDGVYSARSGASLLAFDDVSQIEVLKGPQGTLFGRNAAAGAISILTNPPSDSYEAMATVRVGEYGEKRGEAMVNIPLTDNLSLRIDGLYQHSDGWLKDANPNDPQRNLNEEDNYATKLALRWKPDDKTTATLTWTHDGIDQPARALISVVPLVPSTPTSFLFPALRPPYPINPATFLNPFSVGPENDAIDNHEWRRLDDVVLALNHDYGWAQISSNTDYRYFHTENLEDEDGTDQPALYLDTNNREKNRSFYQDVKLNHSDSNFDLVTGLSYYYEHAQQTTDAHTNTSALDTAGQNTAGTPPFFTMDELLSAAGLGAPFLGFEDAPWRESEINTGNFSAYAAFGDLIWHATDDIDVTVGARYTHDRKSFTWQSPDRYAPDIDNVIGALGGAQYLTNNILSPVLYQVILQQLVAEGVPPAQAAAIAAKQAPIQAGELVGAATTNQIFPELGHTGLAGDWDNLSPRAVLGYKFAKNMMGYVSFTEGYKAGGFNDTSPPVPGTIGEPKFANEKVRSFEGGIKGTIPAASLQVEASVYHYEYLNKQNIDLVPGVPSATYVIQAEDDEATGADLSALWLPIDSLQLSGQVGIIDSTVMTPAKPLPGIIPEIAGAPTGEPWLSATFSAAYTIPFDEDNLRFDLNQSFRGHGRCNRNSIPAGMESIALLNLSSCFAKLPFDTNAAQSQTDLRATWSTNKDHLTLSLFANNLFDNRYVTSLGGLGVDSFGAYTAEITAPRIVGLDMTVKF